MAEEKTPIPDEIKKSLQKLATATKIDIKELAQQMKEIMDNDPTIQAMDNAKHQMRFAHIMLIKRYSMTGGAKSMYLRPLSKPRARLATIQGKQKYVGGLYALVKPVEKDDDGNDKIGKTQYAAGTLWEKAAESMRNLDPKKVYKTALRANDGKKGLELGGNSATFIEVSDVQIPTAEEWFKQEIEPRVDSLLTPLDELKLNAKTEETDIRVVRGIVLDAGSGESDKMGEWGRYAITDDSYIGQDNFPMWVHPDDVVWGISSELYFIGTASYDEKNDATRFDCHFAIPVPGTDPLPKTAEPKAVNQPEEVSMEDLDAELSEEPKEETKEEPKEEKVEEPTPESLDDDLAL